MCGSYATRKITVKGGSAMDISGLIVLEKDPLFCEVDNALAHAFLRDAAKAVRMAGVENSRDLQASVVKSMLVFHRHRQDCTDCNND